MVNNYENNFLAGDLNINLLDSKSDSNNHFSVFRNMYDLKNIVKVPTCYKNLKGTLLDVLLTNKPNSFQKTIVCETGLSDCHMLIATTLRSTVIKLLPKLIKYRSYKNFNETVFLHEMNQKLIRVDLYRSNDPFLKLTEIFSFIIDKHVPIKSKQIKGNQAPFKNNSLSKIITQKSKVRNKHLKWPSRENFSNYKKVNNKCNSLVKKSKKEYFQNLSNANSSHSKSFWNAAKPFVSNKGAISNENIIIKAQKEEKI